MSENKNNTNRTRFFAKPHTTMRFRSESGRKRKKRLWTAAVCVLLAVAAVVTLAVALAPARTVGEDAPPPPPLADGNPPPPVSEDVPPEQPSWEPFTSAALKAAYEENNDVVGWLSLPGCDIDNRVFQASDNDYYLRRNEAGEYDVWGCYFLDYINVIEDNVRLVDPVNIIYGHSLLDVAESERFSRLKRYKQQEFAQQNPTFTFSLLEQELTFEVFAACDIPISIDYIDPRPDDEKYGATLDYMLQNSYVDFGVPVSVDDRILILSTCTSDDTVRFVVAGRLVQQ